MITGTRSGPLPDTLVAPSSSKRPTSLLVLETYILLVAILPARLVIGAIGAFGSPASLVGLAAFGMWAAGALRPGLLPRTVLPLRLSIAGMWLTGLLSYAVLHLNSVPADEVNSADRWILFTLSWTGVALLAAEGLRDRSDTLRLMRVAVGGAAFSAAVAIVQSRLGFDLTAKMAKLPGLSVAGDLASVLARSGFRRPAGTATHPIELGVMLSMALGPALVLAVYDRQWSVRRRWTALTLIALAIPISISRSGILGAAIVCGFWLSSVNRAQRVRTFVTLMVFTVFVFLTVPGLLGTLRSYFVNAGSDTSISTRTDDYSAVARFVRQSPLIGRGPATFLPKYRILDNQWLAQLIETGIIGAIALAVYYLTPAVLGSAWRKLASDPLDRSLGRMFVGISAVAVFGSMTYDFYAYPMDPSFLALYLGIGGAMYGFLRETTGEFVPNEARTPAVEAPATEPRRASSSVAARTARPAHVARAHSESPPRARSARGALKWSVTAQFLARAGTFVLGLILARLLTPNDFGSYAIALGVFTTLLTVDDLGLVKALVRWPGAFAPAAATARVLGAITGVIGYLITFAVAPFIADATNSPNATGLIRLVTLGVIIDAAFQIVPASWLQREMRQDLWVVAEVVRVATIASVSIVLAASYHSAWALAWGALAGQITLTMTTTALARVPLRYRIDRDIARELLRDSVPYALAALVGSLLLNVDYLILGNVSGPEAVGLYVIAFNVSSWPTTLIGAAVRAVAIPHLSQLHHSGGDARAALRRGLHLLTLVALPFVALLISVPELVIHSLYGPKWIAGSVALRFLAIMSIVRLLNGLVEDALFAVGRSRFILVTNVIWLVALVVGLYVGARVDGIRGVGIGHAVVAVGAIAPLVVMLTRRAGLWSRQIAGIAAYIPAAIAAGLAGAAVRRTLSGPALVQIVVVGAVELTVYVVLLLPLRRQILALR